MGTDIPQGSSLFDVGDRVRFSTFGLWRSGTVTEVRNGLVCIAPDKIPGESWAVQWRNPAVHDVVPFVPSTSVRSHDVTELVDFIPAPDGSLRIEPR